jgi:hypothetical protein
MSQVEIGNAKSHFSFRFISVEILVLFRFFHLLFSFYFVPLEVVVVQLFSLKFHLISDFLSFGSIF